jgi:hypothetical protein
MANSKPIQTKHWLALLTVLFVIVLIAHLAIITSARGQFGTYEAKSTEAFTTRMLTLPSPMPVAESPSDSTPPKVQPPKHSKQQFKASSPALPAESPQAPSSASSLVEPSVQTYAVPTANPTPTEALRATETTPIAAPAAVSGASNQTTPAFKALDAGLHIYKVYFTKNGISNQGNAQMRWQQDGERYALNMLAKYTVLIRTFNVFEQNSTGLLSPAGLLPKRFSDKRLNKSEVAAHFDYLTEKITFSVNSPEVALQAGAQDRVSVIWQLAGLLAAQPAQYPPGSTLTLQTVSASDAEPWLFTVNEPETLNLPTGPQIALRLTRNPRREYDQKIELWFATDLSYLPVRFRFTETNNDYVDAVWQSTQVLPNTLP